MDLKCPLGVQVTLRVRLRNLGWMDRGTVLLCVRFVALSFESRRFITCCKRTAAVALTVGVSIAMAVGMPPRMSGAVTTAEELFAPSSDCI